MKKLTASIKEKSLPQQGFIPMMLSIIGVIAFIIYLVYTRVAASAH